MAGKKNDALEIDALITPTLGDMSKVQREISQALTQAVKPLVDTLSNTKVGLNESALRKTFEQLDRSSQNHAHNLQEGLKALQGQSTEVIRSAKGLRELSKTNGAVAKMAQMLGGYEKTAALLSRGDADARLGRIMQAFRGLNDAAYQISKLPAVSNDTQKLLTQLYKSNSPESFRKLSEVQQRQVREAMSIIDMQDKAFRTLRSGMAKAGMGADATMLDRALKERTYNAKRLNNIVSPAAMERQQRTEQKQREQLAKREQRLQRQEARSAAVSEEKDRILKRAGGIKNLRDPQDIRAVRSGLNRDYNLAEHKVAMARRQPGGMNSQGYKEAVKQLEGVRGLRAELTGLEQSLRATAKSAQQYRLLNEKADQDAWRARGKLLSARNAAEQKADVEAWKERNRQAKILERRNQQADIAANNSRAATARSGASFAEAQRLIQAAGGIGKMSNPLDMASVRSGLNTQLNQLVKDREVARAYGQNTTAIQGNIDALRNQRQELSNRTAQLAAEARALKDAGKAQQRNAGLARNTLQARDLLRQTGGDFSRLGKDQIATLRPYMQDRFTQRSQHAETIGARFGANSPEFARASQSAREYANALAHLNQRSNELRPTISDLGQTVRAFFRYALGYGALYQMLGAVTALGKGLVDLDEHFYNIKAITLSTDSQMQTIEGSIKQVGLTTKFTLNEIAKGAQILAQAGTLPENIPQQLRAVADFAAATGSSLEQSADLLTSFKAVYSDISDGKAADMLTKALNLSKLQGEDLRTIISLAAQTAEGYNVGADQLLAAAAALRNTGIKPSTIATGLRQAMMEIFNPDTKLLKALKARYAQMGEDMSESAISGLYNSFTFSDNPLSAAITELKRIGFGDEASNQFIRAFDIRAFNPLQALVNNADQFNLLSSQVTVGQSATEASEIQLESLRATLENLGAAVVAFSDSIGGDMVRSLQSAGKEATDLVTKLTELDIQLKADGGAGLMSTIGTGFAGGALGALLSGKGVLNRTAGFAVGSVAAGSAQFNSDTGDSSIASQALPALAGLLLVAPALMDFIGGLGGKGDKIRTLLNSTKGTGKAVDGAIEAGTGLATLFSGFGKLADGGAAKGLKGMSIGSVARLGAGLFARAIPVIGLLWTAYELLTLFGGGEASAMQQAKEQARRLASAQGDQFRQLQAQFDKDRARTEEWAIDDRGEAVRSGSTAGTAIELRKHARDLDASVQNTLGTAADALGEADQILRDYAKHNTDQRERDRAEIERLTGKQLTDKQAYDLSAQMVKLDGNVEGYRQSILQMLNRSTDALAKAIESGDSGAIEEAGAMQRVLDTMPELREVVYGRAEMSAQKVSELYVEFSRRMAEETEKGTVSAEKVLEAKVTAAASQIDSAAIALDSSTAIDTVIQQIIDNIRLTEKNTVAALDKVAEKTRQRADELAKEAEQLETQAASAQAAADRNRNRPGSTGLTYGIADNYQREADDKTAQAKGKRQAEQSQRRAEELAEAARKQEEQADVLALARAQDAAGKVADQFNSAVGKNLFNEDFLRTVTANEVSLIQDLQDPAKRAQLQGSGFFKPQQVSTGNYRPSTGQRDLERIILAATQFASAEEELSKKKALEASKAAFASDPAAIAEISRLQNEQKIAERRGNLTGARSMAGRITGIQISEQEKAVERARLDMEDKKANDKADATAATERYYAETAKLQDLRYDLQNKLDEYDKKIDDRELKRRTVEAELAKKTTQKAFTEAVDRGDIDGAKKASADYAKVQAELTELAKKELAAKGYSPEQIELEVRAREDLTTALIDQESAQKRLTSAVLARADFEMRDVGKGPTTGNKGADAFLRTSGIGFTQHQVEQAYERDLATSMSARAGLMASYQNQRAGLTGEELRSLDMSYIAKLEEIDATIGTTAASLQQLRNTFDDEALSAFNPTGLLVQLQNSNTALQNIGETVQGHVVNAFDNLGSSIGRAIVEADDLGDAIEAILYQMSSDIFTDMFNTGFNYMGQQGLKLLTGDGGTGATESDKAMSLLGSLFGGGDGETGITAASATVNAGTVMLNGTVMGGGAAQAGGALGGLGGLGEAAQAVSTGSENMGWMEKMGGMFGSLTGGISDAFSDMSSMFGSLFSSMGFFGKGGGDIGEGMKGGDWAKLGVQIVGSYFGGVGGMASSMAGGMGGGGGGGGGMAGGDFSLGSSVSGNSGIGSSLGSYGGYQGFASGGQPSRAIKGKKSAKRDNLLAIADVGGKAVPIRVEADEGILSRKAMDAIGGERGLSLLNSGKMPGFSVGGQPAKGYNPGQPATTGQEALSRSIQSVAANAGSASGDNEVNIANIYSEQGFADFVTSRSGRKVIINELKKAGVI